MDILEETTEIQEQPVEPNPNPNPKINIKDELILNIKEWITSDVEISKLKSEISKQKAELKEKTSKQKKLTETLVNVMKNNSIDCFNINGGALVYKRTNTRKTI